MALGPNGSVETLQSVLERLKLTPEHLNIDSLNVQVIGFACYTLLFVASA